MDPRYPHRLENSLIEAGGPKLSKKEPIHRTGYDTDLERKPQAKGDLEAKMCPMIYQDPIDFLVTD
jgi:hypothetical protein